MAGVAGQILPVVLPVGGGSLLQTTVLETKTGLLGRGVTDSELYFKVWQWQTGQLKMSTTETNSGFQLSSELCAYLCS